MATTVRVCMHMHILSEIEWKQSLKGMLVGLDYSINVTAVQDVSIRRSSSAVKCE